MRRRGGSSGGRPIAAGQPHDLGCCVGGGESGLCDGGGSRRDGDGMLVGVQGVGERSRGSGRVKIVFVK